MKKYTRFEKKGKYWVILTDITGYKKSKRLIRKDKKGKYIIIGGIKKYV